MSWLVGIIWAAFAPALMLVPGYALYLAAGRIDRIKTRRQRIVIAAVITLSTVFAIWLRDSTRFDAHCDAVGRSQIFEKRKVDGFFLDDSTANSFGMRYLQDEGFQWIEARSIYNRSGFTRYELNGTRISQKEIQQLTATVEVKAEFAEDSIASTTILVVRDRQTEKVLARAGNSNFNGGTARIVLGAWGTRSCHSHWSSAGTEEFNRFYHLAKLTLR
jgi:hypothetical protein